MLKRLSIKRFLKLGTRSDTNRRLHELHVCRWVKDAVAQIDEALISEANTIVHSDVEVNSGLKISFNGTLNSGAL